MDQVIKAFLIGFASVITPFIQDVVYDTIPHGEVLKMVDQFPTKRCHNLFDGCNTCSYSERGSGHCTAKYCEWVHPSYCIRYHCPDNELPVEHNEAGPLPSPTNLVCGTNLNVTVGACYCKPEYSYRDTKTLKCVKRC